MWALTVERVKLSVDVKHADRHVIDGKHAGFALGDVADFADGVEFSGCFTGPDGRQTFRDTVYPTCRTTLPAP